MKIAASFVILLSSLLVTAQAQSGLKWEKDLKSALERAKSEKRPLMICMHTSTEVACQRMVGKLYTEEAVQARMREFVLLATCFDKHDEETATIDGNEVQVSTLFKNIGCDALMKNEQDVREHFFENSTVKVPQHIFVDPDGEIYMTKIYELKEPAFIDLMNRALIMYGGKASEGFEEATKKLFDDVKDGDTEAKEAAVKAIIELGDPAKLEILYLTILSLRKEEEQGVCIRAMGYEEMASAAPIAVKFLDESSDFLKNCAVVTLEEMKADQAEPKLRALFEKTRDKHLKKDILRALGPAGAASEEAKALLIENAESREEEFRNASYMSLGHFMSDTKVQELLPQRYKKEGKDITAKTAILWAFATSRDESLVPVVQEMTSKERNKQIEDVAGLAITRMRGDQGPPAGAGGGGGGGRGEFMRLRKALSPLYVRDKIERNRIKEWKKWGGGGGGR